MGIISNRTFLAMVRYKWDDAYKSQWMLDIVTIKRPKWALPQSTETTPHLAFLFEAPLLYCKLIHISRTQSTCMTTLVKTHTCLCTHTEQWLLPCGLQSKLIANPAANTIHKLATLPPTWAVLSPLLDTDPVVHWCWTLCPS